MLSHCAKCAAPLHLRLRSCPDGREGCIVAHYDPESFICACGHDNSKTPTKKLHEKIGKGILNPRPKS